MSAAFLCACFNFCVFVSLRLMCSILSAVFYVLYFACWFCVQCYVCGFFVCCYLCALFVWCVLNAVFCVLCFECYVFNVVSAVMCVLCFSERCGFVCVVEELLFECCVSLCCVVF